MNRAATFTETADKWLGRLAGLFAVFGAAAVVILVVVTVVAVFWRYVLNDPIFGIEDLSTMALTVVVAGAIAYGATRGAHVSVNVISYFVGRSVTRWTDLAVRLLGTATMGFAAYALAVKGSCGFECGAFTANLFIIHMPFYYTLSLGIAFYALLLAAHLIAGLMHFSAETDPHETPD